MSKKLRITWQGGAWDLPDGPPAVADLPEDTAVRHLGDTLVFHAPEQPRMGPAVGSIRLAVTEARLISALLVDEESA